MKQFNFNSQICTTREQSERLLALGLKKETSDMKHIPYSSDVVPKQYNDNFGFNDSEYVSAWSLGRLIEMMPKTAIMHTQEGDARIDIDMYAIEILVNDDPIAEAVSVIEWLIKEGDFNKEYLV